MATFCKHGDCPASQDLLAFQNGETGAADGSRIRRHLAVCEFCAAEMEFYGHYPPVEEAVKPEKIPQPLYELAEALLHNRPDLSALNRLIREDRE
jgi:hypothetical protein